MLGCVIKSETMRWFYIVAAMILTSPVYALEIHFRPSFVELVSEGVSQRVRPGELVEVPVGDSMLEMSVGENHPRKVDLSARGKCEFEVFGSLAVLEDGGTMSIGMEPESRKLDIAWVRGEMKSPPGQFDKAATASFFSGMTSDSMRSMDFPGVRPFGYTDALEGRGSMVAEGDYRNLPPLPPPPISRRQQPTGGYYPEEEYIDPAWGTYEEESSSLPPLSLPPPNRRAASSQKPPRQVLMLSPAPPDKAIPAQPDTEAEDSPTADTAPKEPPLTTDAQDEAPTEPQEEVSTIAAQHKANPKENPTKEQSSQNETLESPAARSKTGNAEVKQSEEKVTKTKEVTPQAPHSQPPPSAQRKDPTLYDRIVAQEEKQKAVLDLLQEVSQQVKELKTAAPSADKTPNNMNVPSSVSALAPDSTPAPQGSQSAETAKRTFVQPRSPLTAPATGTSTATARVTAPVPASAPAPASASASVPAPAPAPATAPSTAPPQKRVEPASQKKLSSPPPKILPGSGDRSTNSAQKGATAPEVQNATSARPVSVGESGWDFSLEAVE